MRKIILALAAMLFISCSQQPTYTDYDPTEFVNPLIGTTNKGNTNPGATTPWGMVTVTPHNILRGMFKSSGDPTPYTYGNDYIYGFSHTAISGIGCHESGSIMIMPVFGELKWKPEDRKSTYSMESAMPGYYKVRLNDGNIFADMTATTRTGLSRFRFQDGYAYLIFDLSFGVTHYRDGKVKILSPFEIEGYKYEGGFCGYNDRRKVYFAAKINRSCVVGGVFKGDELLGENVLEAEGEEVGAYFKYRTRTSEDVIVAVGISYVSQENAWENLETSHYKINFLATRNKAHDAWEEQLSKIKVYGGTPEHKTMFYTALYHSLLSPHIFQDEDGSYLKMNGTGIGKVESTNRYSVYSLWDTYRTLHPFLATFYPQQQIEMVNSALGMYEEGGWLPKWELHGDETYVMNGDPALPMIADSYMKGLGAFFDTTKAFQAMLKHGHPLNGENHNLRPAGKEYEKFGYIPHENDQGRYMPFQKRDISRAWGSVSVTLEYAFADWAIAQMAKKMGNEKEYEFFMNRSQNYKNLFDKEIRFLRPKHSSGEWYEPFDPAIGTAIPGKRVKEGTGFCEGSAWNYTFFVPHDVPGLIDLMGGEKSFTEKLSSMFDNNLFNMGNEPDIAFPFLFNYVKGKEWRTQKTVRDLIAKNFGTGPAGLPGNDDAGTMSAWLLWAMMGLYPDCPASNVYQISSPYFERIEIDLDENIYPGDKFVITSTNSAPGHDYIQSIKLDGAKHKSFTLDHQSLVNGGELVVKLGDKR